jgi:predicted nucleic acid-binding protein
MEVLVDTSVWSLALRSSSKPAHRTVTKLRELIESGISVRLMGIVLQEILQGVRETKQWAQLKSYLDAFPITEPTRSTYAGASQLFAKCRGRGVQLTTIDCLIASVAIENNYALLSADNDFVHLTKLAKLHLL